MPDGYGLISKIPAAIREELEREYRYASTDRSTMRLPDGTYIGYIDKAMLNESRKNPGEYGVYIKVIVMEPEEYRGKYGTRWMKVDPRDPKTSMTLLKPELIALGFKWNGLESLDDPARYEEILDRKVEFDVTNQDGRPYSNLWFRRSSGKLTPQQKEYFGKRPTRD